MGKWMGRYVNHIRPDGMEVDSLRITEQEIV